jgi:serine phosphatase RsbU (regulator of sigma subunit)
LVIAVILAVLVLIGLVTALTLLPAQQLTTVIGEQARVAQQQLTLSQARQMENFFNTLSNNLLSLVQNSNIQSTTRSSREEALKVINTVGDRNRDAIKSIVRLEEGGNPVYGWPVSVNNAIVEGRALEWSIDATAFTNITSSGGVVLMRRPVAGGKLAYLLVAPVNVGANVTEALAVEIDLEGYFNRTFAKLNLSEKTQIWVFDPVGTILRIYQRIATPTWTATDDQTKELMLGTVDVSTRRGFPTEDRETVIASVYTVLGSGQSSATPSLVIVVSREIFEGQAEVLQTRNNLFIAGLGVVLFIGAAGLAMARYVLLTGRQSRRQEQRRATVRTLLEMSRALNSSLDLPVVLNKILDELGGILPYDSASVMLMDPEEDEPSLRVAASRGFDDVDSRDLGDLIILKKLRGAREVVRSGKAVVINDTKEDPRWARGIGSERVNSWMGVPLSVRDTTVGILNINSFEKSRFRSFDEELAEAFADQACVAIENARAHELQIRQYEAELETARAIQTSLLPSEVPPVANLEITAESLPARHVSGDYYQYLLMPDGHLGVAVGDVSGKGIPAALLMAVITTALREEVARYKSPGALLNTLNINLLDRMQQNNMNSALLMAVFDPEARKMEIANGGMVQPYVRVANTETWEFVPVGGYPLGASARSNYGAKTISMPAGSMILFVSDGVIEAQNAAQEFFGFERLEALLNELSPALSTRELVDCVLSAVRDHLGGLEAQDDVTVVALKSQ